MLVLHHLDVLQCWLIFQCPEPTDVRLAKSCGRLLIQMNYDRNRNCQETILGTKTNIFFTKKTKTKPKRQHGAGLLPRKLHWVEHCGSAAFWAQPCLLHSSCWIPTLQPERGRKQGEALETCIQFSAVSGIYCHLEYVLIFCNYFHL